MIRNFGMALFISFFSQANAQVFTETFESISGPGKPTVFINNGQSFTMVTGTPGGTMGGLFGVYIPGNTWNMPNPGGGSTTNGPGGFGVGVSCSAGNCSGISNKFLDNGSSIGKGQTYSIKSTNGSVFNIKSVHLFFSADNGNNNIAPLSVVVSGKKGGVVIFTITKTTGFVTGFSSNNGFNYFNFATEGGTDNSNKAIDEIEFRCAANINYFALDNFSWSSPATLPLRLLEFGGEQVGDNVSLHWRTADEVNVGYFDLQWSSDALEWITIDKQQSANLPGAIENSYHFMHNSTRPVNFYRLKMVDNDGKFVISKVIKLKRQIEAAVTFFPNPANRNLTITLPAAEPTMIQIFTGDGQIVREMKLQSLISTVDLGSLTGGVYVIRITQTGFTWVKKLVKR